MNLFKQSDTAKVVLFYMTDVVDGYTEETGLTLTVTVSKNGGSFGAVAGTVAEVANGVYKLTPDAGDVDTLGPVAFRASATGARPCLIAGRVVAYDPYDAVRQGLTALPNAAADAAGGLPISDAGGLDLDALSTQSSLDGLIATVGVAGAGLTAITTDVFGYAYEDTETFAQFLRLARAIMFGVTDYNGTDSVVFKAANGTTTRITVTMGTGDDEGDRTAVTIDEAD